MQWHNYTNEDDLNSHCAKHLVELLHAAVNQRGEAFAIISGGKTPLGLFQQLAKTPFAWNKVTFCLADERCVPLKDSARNENLVREHLLQAHAKTAKLISLYDENLSVLANLEHLEPQIAQLPEFDLVLLGMGEDGHTASLFPCAEELIQGLAEDAPAVLLVNPKSAPYQRISLSKARLLRSRHLFLHLLGAKKQSILHQAIALNDPLRMPICAFLNQHTQPLQVMYAPS
ncbi:MAG: 6-phosphogluconolactonase [Legionella sp.]|nr:MAG: 6-phosphogluconolactonase [Legionella sp.]